MKKLFFLGTLLLSVFGVFAQQMPTIPADPDVRVGRLDNGLSYYIRHNAKPEKQAEFYILHNVGAVQETDDQQGLAHFLEHMAFNGTKNFPDKGIINYLETIGVKFGANLNAFTSQEMTCYNMSSVPLLREGIVDSCLLVLHDWSYFITLDGAEIDKERGVIVEELRTGNTANRRVREKLAPAMYNNTIFGRRNVIGNEALLKSFSYETLRNFYHEWYRTDQQVIVVVGDIDVDRIEGKLKTLMADIPAVENPTPKASAAIPANDEQPLVGIATDPELTSTQVNVIIRRDALPREMKNTQPAYAQALLLDVITDMATNRLNEISQKPGAPFLQAILMTTDFTAGTDALYGAAVAREGEAARAFEAFYVELEKIQRYGFTPSEWERVKADKLRAKQQAYDNRNDRRNGDFIWSYLDNFRSNSPMPDAQTSWQLDSTLLNMIPLSAINQVAMAIVTDANQSITLQSPAKEGVAVPTEAEMRALIAKVREGEVEAYADNTVKEPLLQSEPKAGKVVKTETDKFGATVWTLSNGAKVLLKQTDFKADELLFSVNTTGGMSLLADADVASAEMLPALVNLSGVGKFPATELEKQLAGKAVRVSPSIQSYENGFGGSASPKDVETALQLLYLYITSPRFDEADFGMMIDQYRSVLANMDANPAYAVQKRAQGLLYPNNPRREVISLAKLDKVTFEASQRAYKQLFSDGGSFTYTFVGNIAPEVLKPLVEKYIGSLPSATSRLQWKDDGVAPAKGALTDRFTFPMQTPKTTAVTIFSGEIPYTLAATIEGSILKQILDMRYVASIREEKGGTYGVGVRFSQNDRPKAGYQLLTQFDTDPAMADELMAIIVSEIQKIADDGATPEDLAKAREFMVKQRQDDLKRNAVWLNYIDSFYINQIDLTSDYDATLDAVTGRSIGELAKKVIGDGNIAKVIMDPAPAAK